MNRKGIASAVVGTIIAVVVCTVVLFLFFFFKGDAESDFYDKACQAGCGVREVFEFGGVYMMGEFCITRPADVYPDDWAKCNSTFKETNDVKGCLADQVAELARRCWTKRGAGELDCGDLDCYDIRILGMKDGLNEQIDVSMDWNYFNDFLKTHGPPIRSEKYSDFFKQKVYFDKKIDREQCWTIKYIEDNDYSIWGVLLQLKDAILLEYRLDCFEEKI